jgi:hypothetical protein
MKIELASTALACGWTGLFATVWFRRRAHDARLVLDADRNRATRSSSRPTEPHGPGTDPARTSGPTTSSPAPPDGADPAVTGPADGVRWFEVDLFPTPGARAGSRFDDIVALPIDTPRRLDAVVHAASLRLRALPDPTDLSHRTITYRARLTQIVLEATQARQRLRDGTYGHCVACSAPVSLALLAERPWRLVCIHCALDI